MARQTRANANKATATNSAAASAKPRKATGTRKAVIKASSKVMPTEEQIRARAFDIYLRRNCAPGDPAADWYDAERELRAELQF